MGWGGWSQGDTSAELTLPSSERREPLAPPKRCVFVFTPCGVDYAARVASVGASEEDFTLGPGLAPLASFKDRMLLLDGVQLSTSSEGPGGAHQIGIGHLLTGQPLLQGGPLLPFDDGDLVVGWGGGISVDQRLAQVLGGETWLRSLHLGVQTRKAPVLTLASALFIVARISPSLPKTIRSRSSLASSARRGGGQSLEVLRAKRLSILTP